MWKRNTVAGLLRQKTNETSDVTDVAGYDPPRIRLREYREKTGRTAGDKRKGVAWGCTRATAEAAMVDKVHSSSPGPKRFARAPLRRVPRLMGV